jgi:T5SS/PEP-CTERM-associated repeat protein
VSAAGHVSGGAVTLGVAAKSAGSVSVAGVGSSFTSAGAVVVGDLGAGLLSVTAGGHFTSASLAVGNAAGGSGSVSVAGVGSVLSTGALTLGATSALGTLSVAAGGKVTASGVVNVANGGVVLNGGTFAGTGTGHLTVAAGGTVTGNGTLSASALVDLGRIGVSGGTLTCVGPLTGTGKLSIAGGDLALHGTVASTLGVEFLGAGTLTIPGLIASSISGWAAGDVIDLTGVSAASATLSGQVLSLFNTSHALVGTLNFAGTLAANNFTVGHDAGTGTAITFHI